MTLEDSMIRLQKLAHECGCNHDDDHEDDKDVDGVVFHDPNLIPDPHRLAVEKSSSLDETLDILARFEEGKSVDVPAYLREHGNPDAADQWEAMNEEHGDNFKEASRAPDPSGRGWENRPSPNRWLWSNRETNVAFTVLEKSGPGSPIYVLQVLTDNGMFQHTKPFQWKDPKGAFKAAASWYKALAGEGFIGVDMTTNWRRMASAGSTQMVAGFKLKWDFDAKDPAGRPVWTAPSPNRDGEYTIKDFANGQVTWLLKPPGAASGQASPTMFRSWERAAQDAENHAMSKGRWKDRTAMSIQASLDCLTRLAYQAKPADLAAGKKLIKKYLAKGKPFTFQDVYSDASDPADLDLYQAFSEMVKAGEIKGPDPLANSTRGNHSDWKYTKVGAGFLYGPGEPALDAKFNRMTFTGETAPGSGWYSAHGSGMVVFLKGSEILQSARRGGGLDLWGAPGGNARRLGWVTQAVAKRLLPAMSKSAATQWVGWVEDADGNMLRFFGPSSKGGITKKLSESSIQRGIDDKGWEATWHTDVSATRTLGKRLITDQWFAKLPKGDQSTLASFLDQNARKKGSDLDATLASLTELADKQARKQMLLPQAVRSKLPKLYSTENDKDPTAWVKFFNPYGRGTWLITEFDGRDRMFGLVDMGHPELGYISLSELEGLEKFPGVQQIERDSGFRPAPLSEAAKKNGINWSPRTASRPEPDSIVRIRKEALMADLDTSLATLTRLANWNHGQVTSEGWESGYTDLDEETLAQHGITAGCEKLDEGPMRDNCESGGPKGKGKSDDKKDDGKMPADLLEKFKKKADFSPWASDQDEEEDDEKQGRHEKGKSVDPTKDMSPEDAAKWKEENEKNRDKFKSARSRLTKDADERVNLWIAVEGSRLIGAQEGMEAASPAAWRNIKRAKGRDLRVIRAENVPLKLAEKLVDWGAQDPRLAAFRSEEEAFEVARRFLRASLDDKWGTSIVAARAPSGLYGYTKGTQSDCEASLRKLGRSALTLAKAAYRKDEKVAAFLAVHAKRSNSLPAQILTSAMAQIGPKVAAQMAKEARLAELREQQAAAKHKKGDRIHYNKKVYEVVSTGLKGPLGNTSVEIQEVKGDKLTGSKIKTDLGADQSYGGMADKPAKYPSKSMNDFMKAAKRTYGLYGHLEKTASLGLVSCQGLREAAGRIACDLHRRRGERHAHIVGFLKAHQKEAKCSYARLLHASYPDESLRLAHETPTSVNDWLTWED